MMILETFGRLSRRTRAVACLTAALALVSSVPVSAADTNVAQQLAEAGEFGAASDLANPRGVAEPSATREVLQGTGADYQVLIQMITTFVEPDSWLSAGGDGPEDPLPFDAGISVDPTGVLSLVTLEDVSGNLAARGITSRNAALNADMARPSELRLVSLTRLEKLVAQRIAEGKPVVESMKKLAGLSQIQYVFVYPESGEIVIGGPAEGWKYDEFGMALGNESGRPILQLDDLVTVLRTFSEDGSRIFGCSIDPKQANVKAVQEYATASQASGPLTPAATRRWAKKIGEILGMQDITVYGVDGSSRVASVLVEADYRMKLIGLGELKAGSEIPDYFTLLRKNPQFITGSMDALRWWMTMQYDSVMHSENMNSFQVRGSAVKCLSENEYLTANGERQATGKSEPLNRQFAKNFTDHFAELAESDPIFADMQGIFDLALVAALIDKHHLDQKANWDRGVFAADGEYRPATYATPKQTESVVNYRVYNGKDIVLQVAGGVRADLMAVANNLEINQTSPRLQSTADQAKASDLPANRWWWDAK